VLIRPATAAVRVPAREHAPCRPPARLPSDRRTSHYFKGDYAWDIHRLLATLIGVLERAGHARLERGDITAYSNPPNKQSRSSNPTRHPGSWRGKPNTLSDYANPSPAATMSSPTPSTSSSGSNPRARHESCIDSYSGSAEVRRPAHAESRCGRLAML
jgi:hypothetical protein